MKHAVVEALGQMPRTTETDVCINELLAESSWRNLILRHACYGILIEFERLSITEQSRLAGKQDED